MTISNRLFLLLFSICLFLSCSKSVTKENEVEVPDTEVIEISEFIFAVTNNPTLEQDLQLAWTDDALTAELPGYKTKVLVPTFKTNAVKVLVNNQEQKSGVTAQNFENPVKYTFVGAKGGKKEILVRMQWNAFSIPQISIHIDGGEEIVEKSKRLQANININGNGLFDNFDGRIEIRGRGNSTWSLPKKPYRFKLSSKSEILGLPAANNWVLLANHLDESLMSNSVAMRIGRDLAVPFTNSTIPVDLTINGVYRGSYVLTQQLEVGENRINITDEGYLLELDSYFDEEYQFKSAKYDLPVMIKSPELSDQTQVASIKTDFEAMESLIYASNFPNNGYRDKFDIDVFARYMLVYFLTGNEEINHPKSTYMHKKTGGKYSFGPIWDFDWAYGYEGAWRHYVNPNQSLFWNSNKVGTIFFKRLLSDPEVQKAFKTHWTAYKQNHFENLIKYVEEYAALIKASQARNSQKWNLNKNFDTEVLNLKSYLRGRSNYIDNYMKTF